MKHLLFFTILIFSLNSLIHASKVDSLESMIGKRIDTALVNSKIDKDSLISNFENYLIENNFISSKDSYAQGYVNFYNYIKCPICKPYKIKSDNQELLKLLERLDKLRFPILKYFKLTKKQYNSLNDTVHLKDFVEFSHHCIAASNIVSFRFENYKSAYQKEIYKLLLLDVFSSFYHINHVINGEKVFSTRFTDKMPTHKKGSQYWRDNLKVKIKYNKKLLDEKGHYTSFSIKDSEGKLKKVETNNQVSVYFIVHKDGRTSNYYIANSSNEKLNSLAIKHLKNIGEWYPAEYNSKKVDCLFFGHVLFYSDRNIKN